MTLPLMPKATAVWLVENTALSFEQIADFCGMHPLEVQGIADGEVATGIRGNDPMASGQLTQEEIERCEKDTAARLSIKETARKYISKKTKGSRYTPVARRQDKPDAIAWLIKNFPAMTDAQISKLVGTTKNTIQAVRGKTHWNSNNIRPRDPVLLGLCSQTHLDAAVSTIKPDTKEAV
ncbi:MAG: cell cycle transcriptional regulator TrcR [Rickettsiales bacterium]|nr:cell cycle transcriptional regulator TrcR [Rickettsiales bacterium]